MPAVIGGPINITHADGVVHFGDSFYIAPKSVSKSFSGSGGGITGNFVASNNGLSATNTFDSDASDQTTANTV